MERDVTQVVHPRRRALGLPTAGRGPLSQRVSQWAGVAGVQQKLLDDIIRQVAAGCRVVRVGGVVKGQVVFQVLGDEGQGLWGVATP